MLISEKLSRNSVFSGSDQPRMLFFLLINVKMPAIVWHFNMYEPDKFHAQLSYRVDLQRYRLVLGNIKQKNKKYSADGQNITLSFTIMSVVVTKQF